jgi:hypothetical protein
MTRKYMKGSAIADHLADNTIKDYALRLRALILIVV